MGRKKFFIQILALVMLLGIAQVAGAAYSDYSGSWETTDTQSSAYTISLIGNLTSGWSFGVYDIAGSNGALALIDSTTTYSTFYVDDSNVLHVTQGISGGSTLTLTSPNGFFGFYFSDGSTMYHAYKYDSAGPVNQWLLKMAASYNAGGPVIASDVAPVPIPSAVWLLGSGLIGLVAFGGRRRKKNMP